MDWNNIIVSLITGLLAGGALFYGLERRKRKAEANSTEVGALTQTVTLLMGRIDQQQRTIEKWEQRSDRQQTQIEKLESKVDELEDKLDAVEREKSDLEAKFKRVVGRIIELYNKSIDNYNAACDLNIEPPHELGELEYYTGDE